VTLLASAAKPSCRPSQEQRASRTLSSRAASNSVRTSIAPATSPPAGRAALELDRPPLGGCHLERAGRADPVRTGRPSAGRRERAEVTAHPLVQAVDGDIPRAHQRRSASFRRRSSQRPMENQSMKASRPDDEKQAQAMQAKMQELQAALERTEVTGVAGAAWSPSPSPQGRDARIKIDPSSSIPTRHRCLEDLIVAAATTPRQGLISRLQAEMAKLTGGPSASRRLQAAVLILSLTAAAAFRAVCDSSAHGGYGSARFASSTGSVHMSMGDVHLNGPPWTCGLSLSRTPTC